MITTFWCNLQSLIPQSINQVNKINGSYKQGRLRLTLQYQMLVHIKELDIAKMNISPI